MKKMLLAASAVGAGIAGLIVYARTRKEKPGNPRAIADKGMNAYQSLTSGSNSNERSALHTMG
jgi:hypothetical protein